MGKLSAHPVCESRAEAPQHTASDNKLELIIEVLADKANAQIKGVNQSLAGIERTAVSVAKNASEGIDGMTASMVKGSLAGNLLAEAIKGAAEEDFGVSAKGIRDFESRLVSAVLGPAPRA